MLYIAVLAVAAVPRASRTSVNKRPLPIVGTVTAANELIASRDCLALAIPIDVDTYSYKCERGKYSV